MKDLVSQGLLYSDGRVRYRVTKNGVEWYLKRAIELKKYARFVMEDIVSHVSVATAIAREGLPGTGGLVKDGKWSFICRH